jgi:hypothetical protein
MPSDKNQVKIYVPPVLEPLLREEAAEKSQTVPGLVVGIISDHYRRTKKLKKKDIPNAPKIGRPTKETKNET